MAEDVELPEHGRLGLLIVIRHTERLHPPLDRKTLIRHLAPLVGPVLESIMHPYEQFLRDEARNEAFENGVAKGQRELLLRLLTERFGSLPAGITQRVDRASRNELEHRVGRILKAASLDDVFAG